MRNVIYAGSSYEVIYEGEVVLHLRSLRDPKLIIHCLRRSEFLREETEHICSGDVRDGEVKFSKKPKP